MENEKRLISVCAWDSFYKQQTHGLEEHDHYCDGYGDAFDHVDDWMDAQPIVDAVEVVHGRCKWCNGDYNTKIMATAIRYHTNGNMDGYEMKVNYCPNCGAVMRERKDNAGTPRNRLD